MPEGHVNHRIAGELNRNFAGHVIESTSPQGRFALGANRLNGLEFAQAQAWGKHMFVGFVGCEDQVNIHLGLLGKFFFTYGIDPADVPVTGAVRWRLGRSADGSADAVVMDLRGPNVCELRTPDEVAAIVAKLGPDPLRDDADPPRSPGIESAAAPDQLRPS